MRVAVTGASGFVGGVVSEALLRRGHDVLALSRRPVRPRPGLEHRRWDLTSGPLPEPGAVDAVVHVAAHVDEWDPWPVHEAVTVEGTRSVLRTWPHAHIVLVSSCSVYPLRAPHAPRHRLTEAVPVTSRPLSAYSRAKAAQERLVLAREDAVVLRPHAVHGPGDTTLLPRLERARRRGLLLCPGSHSTRLHLTDVSLVAEAAAAACESGSCTGVLNVADAAPLRLAEVVAGVAAANAWTERPVFTGTPAAWVAALLLEGAARAAGSTTAPLLTAYAVSHLAVSREFDTTRLRTQLGVEPRPTDLSRWHPGPTAHDSHA
ncbi:NAD-dependent epimerase/dehydratase family protein [Terrabacter sp. AAH1]